MALALVHALEAVNTQVPGVAAKLNEGTLTAVKQQEFAALLLSLGGLLESYARMCQSREDGGDGLPAPDTPSFRNASR